MYDLYKIDEKGRNIYYVYNLKTPSGSTIRTIKYDFGIKGHGIAFVARDCLDTLGYKYDRSHPNAQIYKYVSNENIINGTPGNITGVHQVYIQVDNSHVKPVVLVTLNGFFELINRSNMPDAVNFQYWVNNEVLPALYKGDNMSINIHKNGGIFEAIDSVYDEFGMPNIRGTQGDQIKELITNYARLRRTTYPMAFQEFKKAYWNAYHEDISKLDGKGTSYQKIATNGVYEKARSVLNLLIAQCSNANTGDDMVYKLADIIGRVSYDLNMYKSLIASDPNYIINEYGVPFRKGYHKFSKEQVKYINEYASKNNINVSDAIDILYK